MAVDVDVPDEELSVVDDDAELAAAEEPDDGCTGAPSGTAAWVTCGVVGATEPCRGPVDRPWVSAVLGGATA